MLKSKSLQNRILMGVFEVTFFDLTLRSAANGDFTNKKFSNFRFSKNAKVNPPTKSDFNGGLRSNFFRFEAPFARKWRF